MSFDLTAARLIWIPVPFAGMQSTGDALAEPIEYTVELQVDLIDLDEFSRLFVSPLDADGNPRPDAIPPADDRRIAEWSRIDDTYRALAIVKDWRGVKSGGVTTPFSEAALRKMMRVPNFSQALFLRAFPTAYAGIKDTRLGNSEGSPANGLASADAEQ